MMDISSTQKSGGSKQASDGEATLSGRLLLLVRMAWFGTLGLVFTLFIASIPTYFAFLHTLTSGVVTDLTAGQLTQNGVRSLHQLGLSVDFYATYLIAINALFVIGFVSVGLMMFWRKAHDPIALFTSFVLIAFPVAFLYQTTTLSQGWWWPVQLMSFFGTLGLSLLFFLFPNGRFVPPWTRWLSLGWIVENVGSQFFPDTYALARNMLLFVLLISSIVLQIYRYRRVSTALQRQQTKWVVFGVTIAIVGFLCVIVLGTFLPTLFQPGTPLYFLGQTAIPLFLLFIPFSFGVAMFRYRLWDIDPIINRTLVYGGLSASVIGIYVLVVAYLGALLRTENNLVVSLLATGLVAVLFQPLREQLQRGINRLMYGKRDEPYALMTRLSARLEATLASEAIFPTIVETAAQALKLPYAAMSLWQGGKLVQVAAYGTAQSDVLRLPLVYQAESLGELLLAPRAPGEAFSSADRRLLDELARHAGLAAHAVLLTMDLQRSRERLVTTREEERRRLRRDLHDGLGSALTSVMFKLDASDTLLERDPATARTFLAEGRAQMQAAIADIRRLIYDLRPPILDEWGLLAALREHMARFAWQHTRVTLEAPEPFPSLSAAAEIAVYRIVLEALANVMKHAQATICTIRLIPQEKELLVEIEDNGKGRPRDSHAGVGMSAMRERAAELGGAWSVTDVVPHGTRVSARLPLAKDGTKDE